MHGPSGAAARIRSSGRVILKSRTARRQFTVASFRTLIANDGEQQSPLLRRPAAGHLASLKSRNQYRLD